MEKCKTCFWNTASKKTWPTFEGPEDRIQTIKEKKCNACKKGLEDNYSEMWVCEECGKQIDGHNYFWHASLCDECFDKARPQ